MITGVILVQAAPIEIMAYLLSYCTRTAFQRSTQQQRVFVFRPKRRLAKLHPCVLSRLALLFAAARPSP